MAKKATPKKKPAVKRIVAAKPKRTSLTNNQLKRQVKELQADLLFNASSSRSNAFQKVLDPRRNINDECGYPDWDQLTVTDHYRPLYDRESVATRVVTVLPSESWKIQPSVFETEDGEEETEFEKAWEELSKTLNGKSWYQDEEGNPIWELLSRADKLCGIGHFGVILLGIDDGLELSEPAKGINDQGMPTVNEEDKTESALTDRKLTFLRTFDESLVDVISYEMDKSNPRYGKPIAYNITFNDPNEDQQGGIGRSTDTQRVHWTRIIHIADNLESSDLFGTPRMQPVYNRLYDLRKLYGSCAEMYWRGAFMGLSLESHPQLGPDVKFDETEVRAQLEDYQNGLQRILAVAGVTARTLAPQVVDPSAQIEVELDAICILLGIPKRIFIGSERGELASSQDSKTWNTRLKHRQDEFVTPCIIVPFINRLIMLGILPEPEGFSVVWPNLDSLTEAEKAEVAAKQTESMVKYVSGGGDNLIQPHDFLTRVIGLTDEEAEAVLEATNEMLEEREEEQDELIAEATAIAKQAQDPIEQAAGNNPFAPKKPGE